MIKIVSCFWNASKYLNTCVYSLLTQKDKDFQVYFIDDLSEDNSFQVLENKIRDDSRFHLIKNKEKKYKLRNLDEIISTFDDDDVVIELDGDDFLFCDETISDIRKIYSDKNTWLTNGSFIYSNGEPGFSSKVDPNTIRNDVFRFSHLRTWKTFLWKAIPKNYFLDSDGNYFKSAPDVAYSFALLELSGEEHYKYLPKTYYVYNAESPFNEHKPNSSGGGFEEQERCSRNIRSFPKLKKLNH